MPGSLSPFSIWALDESRTPDERFLTWLVCEACRLLEFNRLSPEERQGRIYKSPHYLYARELYLNPLLMPPFGSVDTERAAEMAPYLKEFRYGGSYETRRIGDAGNVFRFFPALETLELGYTGLKDLSFLDDLPRLRTLLFHSGLTEDLAPLGRCVSLQDLKVYFGAPGPPLFTPLLYWMEAGSLGHLRELDHLTLAPNAALLSGLRFPVLHSADLTNTGVQPDCGHLPDMPALHVLRLEGVQSLRGIDRFPELRFLHVVGPLRDFGDIGRLSHLECLTVQTAEGWPRDVSPLASLPNLLWVHFAGPLPRNYWPLSQAPRLRAIEVDRTPWAPLLPSVQREVEAINAALSSWDDVFGRFPKRPLPPLRFVAVEHGGDRSRMPTHSETPEPDYRKNPKLFELELNWMHRRAAEAVRKATGDPHAVDSGGGSANHRTRAFCIQVETLEAVQRLPVVLDALRGAMAASPHDWLCSFSIWLRLTEMQMTEQQRKWLREIEGDSRRWDDEFDAERYRMKQDHIIETQFRLRLNQDENEEVDPEDFIPPDEIRSEAYRPVVVPVSPAPGGDADGEKEDNPDFQLKPFDEQEQNPPGDGDDDGGGKVVTAPPPEPPESFLDDPYAHPLADSYLIFASLTLEGFFYSGHNLATVVQLLVREPDEFYPAPPKE